MPLDPHEPRTITPTLEVALLALVRQGVSEPEVFLTRRPGGSHLAGYWELPGGKVEPGEDPSQAACREVAEELALPIHQAALVPAGVTAHQYSDRTIRFHIFIAMIDDRTACKLTQLHIPLSWMPLGCLDDAHLPPANAAINRILREQIECL